MVGSFWSQPDTRAIVQPESSSLRLFLRDLQPFTPPDTLNTFVVHAPSTVFEQRGDSAVAVAAISCCQLGDVLRQEFMIVRALWTLTLS